VTQQQTRREEEIEDEEYFDSSQPPSTLSDGSSLHAFATEPSPAVVRREGKRREQTRGKEKGREHGRIETNLSLSLLVSLSHLSFPSPLRFSPHLQRKKRSLFRLFLLRLLSLLLSWRRKRR
jgi:hypothetical protein